MEKEMEKFITITIHVGSSSEIDLFMCSSCEIDHKFIIGVGVGEIGRNNIMLIFLQRTIIILWEAVIVSWILPRWNMNWRLIMYNKDSPIGSAACRKFHWEESAAKINTK